MLASNPVSLYLYASNSLAIPRPVLLSITISSLDVKHKNVPATCSMLRSSLPWQLSFLAAQFWHFSVSARRNGLTSALRSGVISLWSTTQSPSTKLGTLFASAVLPLRVVIRIVHFFWIALRIVLRLYSSHVGTSQSICCRRCVV